MGNFFVYIVTNPRRSVLYTGITNDLEQRLIEHYLNKGDGATFAGRYYCYCLIHFERYPTASMAIEREKEIKSMRRSFKEELIAFENPDWIFLNSQLMQWPPANDAYSR